MTLRASTRCLWEEGDRTTRPKLVRIEEKGFRWLKPHNWRPEYTLVDLQVRALETACTQACAFGGTPPLWLFRATTGESLRCCATLLCTREEAVSILSQVGELLRADDIAMFALISEYWPDDRHERRGICTQSFSRNGVSSITSMIINKGSGGRRFKTAFVSEADEKSGSARFEFREELLSLLDKEYPITSLSEESDTRSTMSNH